MFILFLCAILWNIIDCSVTPPANYHAWDDDDWRWWLKRSSTTTWHPFITDHDYGGGSDNSVVAIIIIVITLVIAGLMLACKYCCDDCTCDDDSSDSTSSSLLHSSRSRVVPPPRDRIFNRTLDRTPDRTSRQTTQMPFPEDDSVNSYLRDRFPIPTIQAQRPPASTPAPSTDSIFRVQLFPHSSSTNSDDNNIVENRSANRGDKPPGYIDVIRSDPTKSNFPVCNPIVPESPPPKYDDHKY